MSLKGHTLFVSVRERRPKYQIVKSVCVCARVSVCLSSGCEVKILGVRPSFCEEYVYNPSEKNLTDSIVNALNVLR